MIHCLKPHDFRRSMNKKSESISHVGGCFRCGCIKAIPRKVLRKQKEYKTGLSIS